ncbi:MAG: adenosylmethionine--8-amino-7-oxononanoate transaminase [Kiritimatiellae bacterium]|nr:adenosylmethionine--8-amino-7-oxononanoate transaminase [Kiritimatiellia bacterium]
MARGEIVFVSGIDTDVGKSVVTGVLARRLREAGRDAITVKLVQTGNVGRSEDVELHRRLMGGVRFPEDDAGLTAPQVFAFPASAELAARLEGRRVDLRRIVGSVNACARRHEVVLVESAGGLFVPLTAKTLAIDLAARERWPVVLVTNGRLGSVNQTLAAVEALLRRGMELRKVVYDWAPGVDPTIDADTPRAIERVMRQWGVDAPVEALGRVDVPPDGAALRSAEAVRRYDRRRVWHPYASLKDPPPVRVAVAASGTDVVLADGRRLVDAVSSWWCAAHGHDHPAIVEAIRRQSREMCHVMFGGFTHAPAVALAERLAAAAPRGLDRVFFADSGSIAVEVAVKMALQYQHARGRLRRTKMLALKGGYHGDTACAMALSDPDGMHTLFAGMMPRHFFADKPSVPFGGRWVASAGDSLREAVRRHRDEIAGIVCEPVLQAANAMNFYHPDYLKLMRSLADENDFVLVFDEIAAGFHRTGPRWAAEAAGVRPDVMAVGKALTGGHITLAATLASAKVADTISNGRPGAFMHGPTYMANPLACAAGVASLDLFAKSDYKASVRRIEGELRAGLEPARALPNVRDVRVLGAVGVIEVGRMPARADIDRVIDAHGVWLRPFSNFIYTMPPLVSDTATVGRIAAAMLDLASAPPGPEPSDPDFHE